MATFRTDGFTEYPNNPANSVGKKMRSVFTQNTITAAGATNGDVYILTGAMTLDDKINAIIGATPALTSANDNDLGFFKKLSDGTFEAIDADILWNGVDLSSALSYRELLGTLNTSLDRDDNIGTLLGLGSDSEPFGGVYLGLTILTKSTATTVDLKLQIVIEEATTV